MLSTIIARAAFVILLYGRTLSGLIQMVWRWIILNGAEGFEERARRYIPRKFIIFNVDDFGRGGLAVANSWYLASVMTELDALETII